MKNERISTNMERGRKLGDVTIDEVPRDRMHEEPQGITGY